MCCLTLRKAAGAALLTAAAGLILFAVPAHAAERTPWTTSRLAGSPEPPLPFTVEKIYPEIKWENPIYALAEPGGDHDRILIVQQGGEDNRPTRIFRLKADPATSAREPFFELPGWLVYAMTFDPDFASNGFVYLFQKGAVPSLRNQKGNRISRYRVLPEPHPRIDPKSELPIIEWRSDGHDGGDLAFGNDGMLYIPTGDGTGDSDGWNSGQTLDDLLGAVLRVDVRKATRQKPYVIPEDNPFVNEPGARAEIWAYGLRNPWRITADPKSGQIWVGNNGQDLWETAHLLGRGENYGWSLFEGRYPFYPNRKLGPTPHVPPTIAHPHSEFRSLTGGVVYRGKKWPELEGAYVYGDYSTGRIWAASHDGEKMNSQREIANTSLAIAGFANAPGGDLLVVDHLGHAIWRLKRGSEPAPDAPPFPDKLSETGLFKSGSEGVPQDGVIAYSVNAPGWNDGAHTDRWMAVPRAETIAFSAGHWEFPNGTALVQTLSLPPQAKVGGPARVRVETRILLRQQNEWEGYSYRWNDEGTDATLVPREGADLELTYLEPKRPWRFSSRAECAMCHNRAANYVLGITGSQLNRVHAASEEPANQLRRLQTLGFFSGALPDPLPAPAVNPYHEGNALEARVRSYLHLNCSICHVESGGGNAKLDLRSGTSREKMSVFEARPQHATFGLPNAMIVAPGHPDRSVMVHRVSLRGKGSGQMPPLGSSRVDEAAVKMLRDWIARMEPTQTLVKEWTMDDFATELAEFDKKGHDYLSGRAAFTSTGCVQCHQFGGQGGSVGPNLAGLGAKLSPRDLLESILEPSKRITEGFAVPDVDPPVSTMPPGMINVLTRKQVIDLVYYLKRDGRPRVAAVVTEYRHNSHADVIVSRILQTDTLDSKGKESPLDLVSLYTDQVPKSDTSRKLAAAHKFPIFPSIAETLTLGTDSLAVDGVLLIAEHGDYPKSETGNTQYPKRRFWEEVLKVFDSSGRSVPVFVDKHLADNWEDAKFIYDTARQRKVPLMAGSSLPTTWRKPAVDVPRDEELREIVGLTFHTTDAYGFHALEFMQALAEQRRGGETGIVAVKSTSGEDVWRAFEEKRFDRELFDAAWSRLTNPPEAGRLRERVAMPRLFTIEYTDGLIAHLLELNGAVGEWSAAWRYEKEERIESSLFWTQEGRPGMHFTWLLNGIEQMILTGQPAWNVERTLYTSGTLDALLISVKNGGQRLETPYLNLPYQPSWRWKEPPPPPPMRPWAEQ